MIWRIFAIVAGVAGVAVVALAVMVGPRFWRAGDAIPTRVFTIPSENMLPTLMPGDVVRAWRTPGGNVKRGDIIVFQTGDDETWIKRVVGLPGDTIEMRGGIVILNGKAVEQRPAGAGPDSGSGFGTPIPTRRYREQFPGEAKAHFIVDREPTQFDTAPPMEVAPGHLFLMGDNRDNSQDSRVPNGPIGGGIPVESVYGIVTPPAQN